MNEEISRFIEQSPFLKHIGFELERSEQEAPLLKLAIRRDHFNMRNNLHGGVHAAMLDAIQTLLIKYEYGTGARPINTNIHYIAPSNEGVLFARAVLIQRGYRTAAAESEIKDSKNNLVAKGSGVYKILR